MAVHLQGNPADLDRILRHRAQAQASGCSRTARRASAAATRASPSARSGDIGIYSLQLNKTITAGEGGAVVTSDPVLFERAARFHDVGGCARRTKTRSGKPSSTAVRRRNFRMNEFTGGVLLAQVRKLDTDRRLRARQCQARLRRHPRSSRHQASASCPTRRASSAPASSSSFKTKEVRDLFLAADAGRECSGRASGRLGDPAGAALYREQAHHSSRRGRRSPASAARRFATAPRPARAPSTFSTASPARTWIRSSRRAIAPTLSRRSARFIRGW